MSEQDQHELNQFEALIQGLLDQKYAYVDDFLPAETIQGLVDNLSNLCISDAMKWAGIGNKMVLKYDKLVRNDRVHWIEDDTTDLFEKAYMEKINRFIQYLNTTCYTSIKTYESHYANYEVGSFYKKHIDQFKTEKGRKFSIILYLNQDWKEEDGGKIGLYPKGADPVYILPTAGRIVFFRSDELEHEVFPSHTRERNSIAGWMKN